MRFKILIAIIFTASITALAMQNMDYTQFNVFLWTYYAPKIAIMLLMAALGFILGLTIKVKKKRKQDSRKQTEPGDASGTPSDTVL